MIEKSIESESLISKQTNIIHITLKSFHNTNTINIEENKNVICPRADNILGHYNDYFDSVYIILNPFFYLNSIKKNIQKHTGHTLCKKLPTTKSAFYHC